MVPAVSDPASTARITNAVTRTEMPAISHLDCCAERYWALTCTEQCEDDEDISRVAHSPEGVVGQQEGIYGRENGGGSGGMYIEYLMGIVNLTIGGRHPALERMGRVGECVLRLPRWKE